MILEKAAPVQTEKKARITKADLVSTVAKKAGLSQVQTKKVLDAMIEVITEELSAGNKITLTGFGAFEVRTSKERQGVNPRTKAKITIPSKKRAAFAPGAALKRVVEN